MLPPYRYEKNFNLRRRGFVLHKPLPHDLESLLVIPFFQMLRSLVTGLSYDLKLQFDPTRLFHRT